MTPRYALSCAIMTHPSRIDQARRLRDTLAEVSPRIVVDPEPDRPGNAAAAAAAWAAVDDDASHHVVFQDDAVVPRTGLVEAITGLVAAEPTAAISLFAEAGSRSAFGVHLARLTGRHWTWNLDAYVPDVALVVPAGTARAGARAIGRHGATVDDVAIRDLLLATGVRSCVPVPNLVEHGDSPSLTGNAFMGPRRAAYPAPEPAGPIGGPWDAPCLVPTFDWQDLRGLMATIEPVDGTVDLVPLEDYRADGMADVLADVLSEQRELYARLDPRVREADGNRTLRTISRVVAVLGLVVGATSGPRVPDDAEVAEVCASCLASRPIEPWLRRRIPEAEPAEILAGLRAFLARAFWAGQEIGRKGRA